MARDADAWLKVNPQAVREDFPVYTANRRDIVLMKTKSASGKDLPVVIVAVGAMLVGSIVVRSLILRSTFLWKFTCHNAVKWTVQEGQTVEKGSEQGKLYFLFNSSAT